MEGEGVDGPHVVDVVDGLAVAFERIYFSCEGEGSKYSTEAVAYPGVYKLKFGNKRKGERIKEREKKKVKAPYRRIIMGNGRRFMEMCRQE